MGRKLGGSAPFLGKRDWVPIYHKVAWAQAETYFHTQWHFSASRHLATTDMGRKLGGSAPFLGRGNWVPCNTMWPGSRPTCLSSFILINPTVWPQCHSTPTLQTGHTGQNRQTERQTVRQRLIAQGEPFYKRSPKNSRNELQQT